MPSKIWNVKFSQNVFIFDHQNKEFQFLLEIKKINSSLWIQAKWWWVVNKI